MARSTEEIDDCAQKLSNGHSYHLENGNSLHSSKRKCTQKPKHTSDSSSKFVVQSILMTDDCSYVGKQIKSKPCRRSERKIMPSSLWDHAVINPYFERKRRKLSDSPIKNSLACSGPNNLDTSLVEQDRTVAFQLNGHNLHENSSEIVDVQAEGIVKESHLLDCQGHVRLRRSSRKHSSSVSSISDSKYTIKQDHIQKLSSPVHDTIDSSQLTDNELVDDNKRLVDDVSQCDENKNICTEITLNGKVCDDLQADIKFSSIDNGNAGSNGMLTDSDYQTISRCKETFKSVDDEIEVKALILTPEPLFKSNAGVIDNIGIGIKYQNAGSPKSEKTKSQHIFQAVFETETPLLQRNTSDLTDSKSSQEKIYYAETIQNQTANSLLLEQSNLKESQQTTPKNAMNDTPEFVVPENISKETSHSKDLGAKDSSKVLIRELEAVINSQGPDVSNISLLESTTPDLTVSKDDMKSKEAQQLIDGSSFQRFYRMRTRRQTSSTEDTSGILTPIIKRRISSRSNSGTSKTSDDATAADSRKRPKLVKPDILCSFCLQTEDERGENMISCCLCGASGHPSCLQFNIALTERVKLYDWECIECKKCELCRNSGDDATLLFCDDCDKGFHMSCLLPPLSGEPEGHWSCLHCVEGSTYWTDKIRKTGTVDKLLKKKCDKASRRKQLLDDLAMFHEAQSRAQTAMTEEVKATPKAKTTKKKGAAVPPTIKSIELGCYEITAWYSSPYPAEYALQNKLYICEFCLKYMKSGVIASRHIAKCPARCPPGDEIYRKETISVFEVDGRKNKTYCQNLCLLAKLFLDHKTLYYDVEPFLFYILTEYDRKGCHIVGYFSKEKNSFLSYNVSCILVIPPYMKKGYGKMLIDFSYALSRREGKLGSPEKPLSDLGLVSYRNYWKEKLLEYFLDYNDSEITIKNISKTLGFNPYDIVSTLQAYGMIKYHKSNHYVLKRPEMLAAYKKKLAAHAGLPSRYIDMSKLKWTPLSQRDTDQ